METTFTDAKDNLADQKKAFDDAKALADGWAAKEKKRIEDKRIAEREKQKEFITSLKSLEKEEHDLFNELQAAEKKAVADRGKEAEKDSMLALTDATAKYEAKARELNVAMDKFDKMKAQEDATRAEEAKEMEGERKKAYAERYAQMEEKKNKYDESKTRKEWLTAELAGLDAKIAAAKDEEKAGLEYDKKQWTAELAAIPDLAGLKTAYEDQKKAFDKDEAEAKALARKKVNEDREAGFDALKTEYDKLKEDFDKAKDQVEEWRKAKLTS